VVVAVEDLPATAVAMVAMVATHEIMVRGLAAGARVDTQGMAGVKTPMALAGAGLEDKTSTAAPLGRMDTVVVSVYLVRDLVAHLVLLLAVAVVMHPVIQHFLVGESSVVVGRV
jgi:hypothetical protein